MVKEYLRSQWSVMKEIKCCVSTVNKIDKTNLNLKNSKKHYVHLLSRGGFVNERIRKIKFYLC